MFQFVESLCCENKQLRNLDYHQKRFDDTREDNFSDFQPISLKDKITINNDLSNDKYKVRVVYDKDIQSIEFLPYTMKTIETIKLFTIDDKVNYSYKYVERSFFDEYINETKTDDLVLVKSNYITDCIYSNIVFFDGEQWITPKTFLLKGTMRESLLDNGKILQKNIKVSDLNNFKSFKRINAMMNLDESQEIDISYLL
ncbi:aminotransferase class IV [Chishuiella sp.]|uniref:aminotransferase class IV n=1 Tax=Chishuiella sp. TaxID=1969467 RepID=UPI0028A7B0FA|nr:aminotransferase class IV [Chishuiella sp.]